MTTAAPSAHLDTFTRDHLPPRDQWPDLIFTLPELRYPSVLNCADVLLDQTVNRLGRDRPCLRGDQETWTYGQLQDTVDRIAAVLADDLAVVPGSRVLLRGPNNPWLVACWLAVIKAGAVVVATMPLLRAGELKAIIDAAEVGLALCDSRWLDELNRAGRPVPVVAFGSDQDDDLSNLVRAKPEGFAAVPTAADDVCLIAFTSGTTGRPKGCMHFHRDVLACADTFAAHVVRPHQDDVFTGSPPLAFTFGLGSLVIFPLRAGASVALLEQAGPEQLAAGIRRHRATVCSTAPTAYRAMLRLDGADLSSLRRCVSAGETLPLSTWEAWRDRTGLAIIDGLGSTEMLHIFVAASDDDIRPGATGRAVPGYEAVVLGPDGDPLPPGEVGRLAVRGPTGCRYLSDDRQRTYVQDGWNITGDAYLRDEDGYFWYQARIDDMIISSGYNIAGPEVEAALLTHPDVVEAGVVGAPDADRGTIVKAFVVLSPGVEPSAATAGLLQAHVKATIAPYKYPREVVFVTDLPKTADRQAAAAPAAGSGFEPGRARSRPVMADRAGRVAVVTGGAKGIGLAISLALAGAGARVIAFGRDQVALEAASTAGDQDRLGTVEGVVCDVTDEAASADVLGAIGPVDVLVNNAGAAASNPLARTTLDEWEDLLRVNATGPFLCTRAVLPGMQQRGFGRIVTVASIAGHVGGRYVAAYTASKHAVVGLMRSVAAEVAGTGVTANSVCPAYVRSEMTERSVAAIVARTGRSAQQAEAALASASPLARLVEPDEVAAAVLYLASDDAGAVNGQSIILDGGGIQQ